MAIWVDLDDGLVTVAWRMITLGFDLEEFAEFAGAIGKAAPTLVQLRRAVKPGNYTVN